MEVLDYNRRTGWFGNSARHIYLERLSELSNYMKEGVDFEIVSGVARLKRHVHLDLEEGLAAISGMVEVWVYMGEERLEDATAYTGRRMEVVHRGEDETWTFRNDPKKLLLVPEERAIIVEPGEPHELIIREEYLEAPLSLFSWRIPVQPTG